MTLLARPSAKKNFWWKSTKNRYLTRRPTSSNRIRWIKEVSSARFWVSSRHVRCRRGGSAVKMSQDQVTYAMRVIIYRLAEVSKTYSIVDTYVRMACLLRSWVNSGCVQLSYAMLCCLLAIHCWFIPQGRGPIIQSIEDQFIRLPTCLIERSPVRCSMA